ncbi:acetyltransferase [Alcaligenaceae bacterium A4P071]|nr:acetyltransferase [Alcaligenaceae bacterium A4P071]
MICLRRSTPKDGLRVMAIWRSAVDATHDFLRLDDRAAIEAELAAFLPTAPLWLAVDANDHVLAFMLLDGRKMEALFVAPEARGTGVGKALVQHALRMHADLTTDVNAQNQQAVGFYERMGFERTGHSEMDAQGRPYPLIHLRHAARSQN